MIEWNSTKDVSTDGRWLVQHSRIRIGRRVEHEYQLLDLHHKVSGTGNLMHQSYGIFDTPAQARKRAEEIASAEEKSNAG